MKQNISLIIILLIVMVTYPQEDSLENNAFIVMPDSDTYINRVVWQFSSDKLEVKKFTPETSTTYDYKIMNGKLIISDNLDWGEIKYADGYFELIDKNNSSLRYTKLKTTDIDCNEHELKEIITSSFWKVDLKTEKSKIHIKENSLVEKNKINYKLVKLDSTYVLFMDDWWSFTVSKISKENIEFYGLAKSNELPEKLTFIRERK